MRSRSASAEFFGTMLEAMVAISVLRYLDWVQRIIGTREALLEANLLSCQTIVSMDLKEPSSPSG